MKFGHMSNTWLLQLPNFKKYFPQKIYRENNIRQQSLIEILLLATHTKMSSSYFDVSVLMKSLAMQAIEQEQAKEIIIQQQQQQLSTTLPCYSTEETRVVSRKPTKKMQKTTRDEDKSTVGNNILNGNRTTMLVKERLQGEKNLSDVGGTAFPIRPYQRQAVEIFPRKNLTHFNQETRQSTREEAIVLPISLHVQLYMTNPFAQNANGTRPNPRSAFGYRMNEIKRLDLPDIETGKVRSALVVEQSFQAYSEENPKTTHPWAAGITALPTGYNSYRLENSRGEIKEYRFYPKTSKSINDRGYLFHLLPTSLQLHNSNNNNILDCGCFFLGVEEVRCANKCADKKKLFSECAPTFRDLPWFLLPELSIDPETGEPTLIQGVAEGSAPSHEPVFNEDELHVLTRAYLLEELCERRKYPFETIMSAVTTYAGFRRTKAEENEPVYHHQHLSLMFDQATGFTVGTMCSFHNEKVGKILDEKKQPPRGRFLSDSLLNITTTDNGYGTLTKCAHRNDAKIENLIQTYKRIQDALVSDQAMEINQTQFPWTQAVWDLMEQKQQILQNNRFTVRMNATQIAKLFVNNFVETHLFEWEDFWKKAYKKCPTKTSDILSQEKDTKSANAKKMKVPYSVSQETWQEIALAEKDPGNTNTIVVVKRKVETNNNNNNSMNTPPQYPLIRKSRPIPLKCRPEGSVEQALSQQSSFRPIVPILDNPVKDGKKRKKTASV